MAIVKPTDLANLEKLLNKSAAKTRTTTLKSPKVDQTAKKGNSERELPKWLKDIIYNDPELLQCSFGGKLSSHNNSAHKIALGALAKVNDLYFGKQEHYLQVCLFYLVETKYPDVYPMMFAVPNGGHRSAGVAGQMKAEGQRAGYPDIGIDIPTALYHGFRLEVKTDKGRPHKEQKDWQERLTKYGYLSLIGFGFDECWSMIEQYVQEINLYD